LTRIFQDAKRIPEHERSSECREESMRIWSSQPIAPPIRRNAPSPVSREVAVRYGKLMNLGQENKTHRLPNAPY